MSDNSIESGEWAEKLDLVVRLLAYLVAAEHDNLQDRAVVLTSLGLSPKEIARVCNTTSNTISVRLAEAKNKGGSKKPAARRTDRRFTYGKEKR